ncbi:MAG: response regulator transcription factor [Terriglobales bacterium]
MPTIFLVEDDPEICRLLRHHLALASHQVECFSTVAAAATQSEISPPQLFLLDVMLPGESGFDYCRRLRSDARFARIPVIFITAKSSESDRIEGFDAGADDYITKPFSPREVVARVSAVLRRAAQPPTRKLKFDAVEIDFDAMVLRVNGEEQKTTTMEFRILQALAASPGRVFSRERLLSISGSSEPEANPRAVDVYIMRLRDKIEKEPAGPSYLRTVRGVGYMFCIPGSNEERKTG